MTENYDSWDAVIIGGGAAGFFGAIACANAARQGARILLVERASRVLQKVKISGGGRCNVTHDCLEPKRMAARYPRGNKELVGPFYRFGVRETIRWFKSHGVELKTEADGRIFPITDDSQTIIDCLRKTADQAGVKLRCRAPVLAIRPLESPGNTTDELSGRPAGKEAETVFEIDIKGGDRLRARRVLVASGGTRLGSSEVLPESLGHDLDSAVPSLFTFQIDDSLLEGMQGLAVNPVEIKVQGHDLASEGPLLITHWGVSGPAVLELSAWGAREFFEVDYDFEISVNWLPGVDLEAQVHQLRHHWGGRQITSRSPVESIPRRLWQRLVEAAGIPGDRRWAEFSKAQSRTLIDQLTDTRLSVTGQSTYKDEFVTCGGVRTDQLDLRTMESRQISGLYFAGEVINIDGITGGFNFQNAWTTGFLAGQAMAEGL